VVFLWDIQFFYFLLPDEAYTFMNSEHCKTDLIQHDFEELTLTLGTQKPWGWPLILKI
jgi:hypothetical protein